MIEPKYKVGERLNYVNGYGVEWGERTVTGIDERSGRPCYFIEPTDTPWFAVSEDCLHPMPPPKPADPDFGSW